MVVRNIFDGAVQRTGTAAIVVTHPFSSTLPHARFSG
jgi:hypothetical protein